MAYAGNSGADEEISRLQEKNEQLKDDLFTLLQQPQDQATDGSIREQIGDIWRSVDFWVDNVIEDSNLDKHSRKLGSREKDLLRELGIGWFTPRSEHAAAYLLLSVAVQRELQKRIFDRTYPVGITKQQEGVLAQVLQGMQTLESGKEQVIRDRWRSEAVRALTAHKDFERNQNSALKTTVEAVMDVLSSKSEGPICGLRHRAFQKHDDTFHNEIFRPAMLLHRSLRSSVHQYTVASPKINLDMDGEQMAETGWKLKDVDTWQDLRRSDPSAQPLCPLYPSIVRESDGRGDEQTIVPAVVIVELRSSHLSGQNSRAHSSRQSPAHSLSSETTSREVPRNREKRRGVEYSHADSTRSRELIYSTETSNTSASVGGNGFLNSFLPSVTWMRKGRSETSPTAKQKPPGKGEIVRTSNSPRETTEYNVYEAPRARRSPERVTVTEDESGTDVHRLQQDRRIPEQHRNDRRGSHSQQYDGNMLRRSTS